MLAQAERQPSLPTDQEVLELMPSSTARKDIEASEWPLRYDEECRAVFYGEMGVVRTELKSGAMVNGHEVLYKDERAQRSGSYKTRGATHAVAGHENETPVTYSTGNHAYSVALAAKKAGCNSAHIEGTQGMSSFKVDLIKPTQATLNRESTTLTEAQRAATKIAEQPGYFLVPPFGAPEVVAGQCTLGEELVGDLIAMGLSDKRVIVPVSVAGGGQLVGFALPIRRAKEEGRLGQNVHVVGVQPEGSDTLRRAMQKLQAGQVPVDLYQGETQDVKCDALVVGEENLNSLTASIIDDPDYVAGLVTVTDLQIARAMDSLETELGGSIEPAAALPRAFMDAYTSLGSDLVGVEEERPLYVLPVSGGNKSPQTSAVYRKIEREATQAEFKKYSDGYARRSNGESGMAEVHAIRAASLSLEAAVRLGDQAPRDDDTTRLLIRKVASRALSGMTAEYRNCTLDPDGR
jgi:threonine dehydratase